MIPDNSQLSRDHLLREALQREELTEEACLALDAELDRRKISPHDIASFASEENAAVIADEKIVREVLFWGIGKKMSGRCNYVHDPRFRIEEFDQTLWFVFFFIPIFPLRTYRIRRRFRSWWEICASDRYRVVAYLPLNWRQILTTWAGTMVVLVLLFEGVPWLLTLTYRPAR